MKVQEQSDKTGDSIKNMGWPNKIINRNKEKNHTKNGRIQRN